MGIGVNVICVHVTWEEYVYVVNRYSEPSLNIGTVNPRIVTSTHSVFECIELELCAVYKAL